MEFLNGLGKKIKKVGLGAMLVGVMSVSLVACGGDSTPSAPAATEPTATTASPNGSNGGSNGGSMAEATVKLSEWAVNLEQPDVPAGKVKFTVSNEGKFSHNYVIMEGTNEVGRTPNFTSAEGPKVVEVDLKPGTYKVLCDIMGHPEQGMTGSLTVK
jgi:uncharacterized cupredoxin-like copper-binding protein